MSLKFLENINFEMNIQKRKIRRRHNTNNKRKIWLRMVKYIPTRYFIHKRKRNINRKRRVVPLIQYEWSKEAINTNSMESITVTFKNYQYYDDFNLNSTPKPLKHPFTTKSQHAILNKSLKTLCESPLLQNWQSITTTDETNIQSLIGNNENKSLIQSSEIYKNYSCLAWRRIIQSSLDESDTNEDTCNDTARENDSETDDECLKTHPDRLLLDEKPECKSTVNQTINRTVHISSSSDDFSDSDNNDSACLKFHPYRRRLQVTKTKSKILNESIKLQKSNILGEQVTKEKAETDRLPKTHRPFVDIEKSSKVSEMWLDILNTPNLWKTETLVSSSLCHNTFNPYCTSYKVGDENMLDFEGMIEDIKEIKSSNNLYEDRFQEKLTDPDFKSLLADFYIPPAKMEILYRKLTSNMSQQECLSQLCTEMGWTHPTYTAVDLKNTVNVHFSCNLKSKSFRPKRPGLSRNLNKELAAFECLNWLGFEQKRK